MSTITFVFAIALAVTNFFSEIMAEKIEKHHAKILSLSSGIFVAYIFVALLPEALKGKEFLGDSIFIYMLAGFVAFHLVEKFVYQHIKNKNELMKDLSELHTLGFVLDHFLVGMVLFFAVNSEDPFLGAIIILPLFIHVISSSISLNHISRHFNKNITLVTTLSISPLLGTLFAFFLNKTLHIYYVFFAVSLGTLLYVSVRDLQPNERGKTRYFFIGIAIAIASIIVAKNIGPTGAFGLPG